MAASIGNELSLSVRIQLGRDNNSNVEGFDELFTTSTSNLRRLSISFSQGTIWFQLRMLWDAKSYQSPTKSSVFTDHLRMLDRELNDFKAGTEDHKTEISSLFCGPWEAAKIGTTSLLWCRRHEAQFGHKPGDRTFNMDHCTSRHFLH